MRIFSAITISLMGLALLSPICRSASEGEETTGIPAGWTNDINISEHTKIDEYPSMAIWENDIHVVWENTSNGDDSIMYRNSYNGGLSWNNITTIHPVDIMTPSRPDIDVNNSNIHVVYHLWESTGWEINYVNSTDGGLSWNPSKMISENDGSTSSGAKIAVNGPNIHVVWTDERFGGLLNSEAYYKRSTDGGITWDDGLGNATHDRRLTYDLVGTGPVDIKVNDSNIHVLLVDDRDGSPDIYYIRSTNNGVTWDDGQGNVNQQRKLSINSTWHYAATMAVSGSNIHVAWIDQVWPGPDYYVYHTSSTDNGESWNTIQLITGPTSGVGKPDISSWENYVHIVWDDMRDDSSTREIYFQNSTDGGVSWSGDVRLTYNVSFDSIWPSIDINGSTVHITWWDDRDGNNEIYYKRYPDFPPYPTYNITLNEGWNLVSLPLKQSNESIAVVLSSINGKWDYLQAYDPLAPEPWKTYATFKPSQLNELQSLNHRMGFWINVTEPGGTTLTISGPIPTSTSINLYAGWNLVGYPSLVNETVANALWGTGADKVMVCDTSKPYHIKEVGPSYLMKPGEGYWVHVPFDITWTINW